MKLWCLSKVERPRWRRRMEERFNEAKGHREMTQPGWLKETDPAG
jgi:hypothetical protein